ncbi:MAG TPA: hypothetical protein VHC20_06225, partial [Candidatus Paceibacterota bacterium]|nr:hypothetical protein [Candidatus Paceibacterota bacterium]
PAAPAKRRTMPSSFMQRETFKPKLFSRAFRLPNQSLEPTRSLALSFQKINLTSNINSRVAHL